MTALSDEDARVLIALLGLLQENLESAIEAATLEGEITRYTPRYEYVSVRSDQRAWRRAEKLIQKLENGRAAHA